MRIRAVNAMRVAKVAAICVSIFVVGCAAFGPTTPEAQVKARAQERRDALLKKDFTRAYTFFTPGYRGTVTADTYRNAIGNALELVDASVESVTCETLEKCIAKVKVEIKPLVVRGFKGTISSYSDETWLYEAGQWWFYQPL
jgi:hypothetical protein